MFLSQFLDVKNKKWQNKSCGIISLKIVLSYWLGEKFNTSVEKLIKLGLKENAYLENIGWKHKSLGKIAEKFGLQAKAFDWFKETNTEAFKKFLTFLKKGPVIVSVYKDFNPKNKNGHLIVAFKNDKNYIYILEPAAKKRNEIFQKITYKKFKTGWKKRVIFISQPKKTVNIN